MLGPAGAVGSPGVPLDDPVYDALDPRALAGELPPFRGGLVPLTEARVRELGGDAPAAPDGAWLRPIERAALRIDAAHEAERGYSTMARPRDVAGELALSCADQVGRPCGHGLGLAAELDAAAGYGAWLAGAIRLRAQTGSERYPTALAVDRAYASAELGPIAVEVGRDALGSGPRFVHERRETIDAKLRMLVFCWMVAGSKGWDALRAPDVAALESLTGFAYMPSTLAKFISALAISGADQPLIEATARRWHEVAEERWHEPGAMAALYIDNHAKEVWSSLFTQSGKVAHLNRVMPCITTTYARALDRVLREPGLRDRLGASARRIVATWDNERMVRGFRDAIACATRQRARP